MALSIMLLVIGFALVVKGADFLVDGASSLAKRHHVSELTIGLTVVAFGTSAPELVVNIVAAIKGYDNVSMGNIIGSNIFNLLFILGVSGLIYPVIVQSKTVWKEIPFSLLAGILLIMLANDTIVFNSSENVIKRYDGIILLLFFCLFLYYAYSNMKDEQPGFSDQIKVFGLFKTILFIIMGFAFLIIGGRMVVINAVDLAKALKISEKVIGLTVVATGTSLPELATSAVAAYKKRSDLAIGNVVGSNIFNILLILGVTSLISPIHYSLSFNIDISIYVIATLFTFIAMFTGGKGKLDRWEAGIMLFLYIAYMVYLFRKTSL
ncbi:MAG TPA: calcium/sodium antiporter [Bacteroidales bacterium]|nr:calcium/sodium antiporter [Bacteroidales bacterium]